MKYLIIVFLLLSANVIADQRMETVGGFCHFVTPEGFATANDDNEVFLANCVNSIRQNADATGSGSTMVKVKYPPTAMPFFGKYKFSGAETGVDCVMVDSNGTTYATQDWDATYKTEIKELKKFQKALGTDNSDYDYNEDGVVNGLDVGMFRQQAEGEIKYSVVCRNGAQQ
jgi:hypothetical protein